MSNPQNLLTRKLSIPEQEDILQPLFGLFFVENSSGGYVLYDEEGDEFYGYAENCQFDFSTLSGIFSYSAHIYKQKGYSSAQSDIRKVLGL